MKIKTQIWESVEDLKNNIEWIIIYNILGILANIITNHWGAITFGVTAIGLDLLLIKSKRKHEQQQAKEKELIMKTQKELSQKEDN